MPFREFGKNDLFYNQIKTFPKSDFIINKGLVYYNGNRNVATDDGNGTMRDRVAPQSFISLFELNVNRQIDTGTGAPPDGKSIYPFITKDGARIAFKTVSTSEFDTSSQFAYGDVIKGDYPLTSSIKEYILDGNFRSLCRDKQSGEISGKFFKVNKQQEIHKLT